MTERIGDRSDIDVQYERDVMAAEYANDNLKSRMDGMELGELCEEFDIGLADGLEVFDAYYGWRGVYQFLMRVRNEAVDVVPSETHETELVEVGMDYLQAVGRLDKLFDEMLCTAIRANEDYQKQLAERLADEYREDDGFSALDEEEAVERDREERLR